MLDSGMNLITTIIGFGMSATFIVFVCTRLICGRLRQIEARQMFEIDSRIDIELFDTIWTFLLQCSPYLNCTFIYVAENQIHGLEPVVVAAIPTMKFNREAFGSMEDAQCSICLGEYQEKEILRIMPKCGHSFHLSCIDIWLRKQSTCPVCRLSLHDSVETKHVPSATLSTTQSFDSSEIRLEHSDQWMQTGSLFVQLENGVARESVVRSS